MKFSDFNCESTSEVSKRHHDKIASEKLKKDVEEFLAKGGVIEKASKQS